MLLRVGTVEGRSTALNIAAIQPELKRQPHAIYLARAVSIDPKGRTIVCKDDANSNFEVDYDLLAIATGSQVQMNKCLVSERARIIAILLPLYWLLRLQKACHLPLQI